VSQLFRGKQYCFAEEEENTKSCLTNTCNSQQLVSLLMKVPRKGIENIYTYRLIFGLGMVTDTIIDSSIPTNNEHSQKAN